MKTVAKIPGPIIGGIQRHATITTHRHSKSASVNWSVGDIDVLGPPSDAFRQRLEEADMPKALVAWWQEHKHRFGKRAWLQSCCRFGGAHYIEQSTVEDLAALVSKFYHAAVINLPLTTELHRRPAQFSRQSESKQEEVESLVCRIDFPHKRDGGGWVQNDQQGRASSLRRACFYAEQLRDLGMSDADIGCLLSDLYWDAVAEMELCSKAHQAPPTLTSAARNLRLEMASNIMAGLLASGHYTSLKHHPGAEDQAAEPSVRRFDYGQDWKKDGVPRRVFVHAVEDAVSLLKDLEAELERQA